MVWYVRYKFRSEDGAVKIVNKLMNAWRYCHHRTVAVKDEEQTDEKIGHLRRVGQVDLDGNGVVGDSIRFDLWAGLRWLEWVCFGSVRYAVRFGSVTFVLRCGTLLCYVRLQYVRLRYIALRYITLRYARLG